MVRTTGFQSVNRGSTPRGITKCFVVGLNQKKAGKSNLLIGTNNMPRNTTTLIAFIGPEIEQEEKVLAIKDDYEIWNLKKFTLDELIEALKLKIPPVNDNVLRNYKLEEDSVDVWGLTEKQFESCSWGIFIPDSLPDVLVGSYTESIFLLNLYSPAFLYPLFYVSDMGITRLQDEKRSMFSYVHYQNQSKHFSTPEFVDFFKMLLPQSGYGTWQLDRAQRWDPEDWRLFVASYLFFGLRDYDNNKSTFGWQRESADMGAILESLFTAGDSTNEEVGYRLRKRAAVLLSDIFPEIEKDISKLYKERSQFVHGAFFAHIARESQHAFNNLPSPDFNLLYQQRERVRWALVAYLHLANIVKIKADEYENKKVIQLLEQAIIDIPLREKLLSETKNIFNLLPPYNSSHL